MYKINQIAALIINYAIEAGYEITPLKLQKVLYYIHGWFLGVFGIKLFNDTPQAWVNGPVYPEIYRQFKNIPKHKNIKQYDKKNDISKKIFTSLTEEQQNFLTKLLDFYLSKSDAQLIYMTHKETPWLEARKNTLPFEISNKNISLKAMEEYFKSLYLKYNEKNNH